MAIEKFLYLSSLGWLLQEYNFWMACGFQVWKFHLKISPWEEKLASQGPGGPREASFSSRGLIFGGEEISIPETELSPFGNPIFPIDAYMVWCPTWSKNLGQSLIMTCSPDGVSNSEIGILNTEFSVYTDAKTNSTQWADYQMVFQIPNTESQIFTNFRTN